MLAGIAIIDITPSEPVWMEGMIRLHPSTGVLDAISVRALVLAEDAQPANAYVIVSVDVCMLNDAQIAAVQRLTAQQTGIPAEHIIVAATHTHSGPATIGLFNRAEVAYTRWLIERIVEAISRAAHGLRPATIGSACGREDTISHYRRLLTDDGQVVMNWEPYDPTRMVGPLGVPDPEVAVIRIDKAGRSTSPLCVLFNHAGHPNVLSGENYQISADYPGVAKRLIEEQLGCVAMFVNGAQGSVDIDGLRDRDQEGMRRIGAALAQAVIDATLQAEPGNEVTLHSCAVTYDVPARVITPEEWAWAQEVLARTNGTVQAASDGVGEDYLAGLYQELRESGRESIAIQQVCLAFGDTAILSFPGELYTEIGMRIKAESPFAHTLILGLANGYIGYIPTRQAIREGGYAEDTRRVDAAAEEIVLAQSLGLLQKIFTQSRQLTVHKGV